MREVAVVCAKARNEYTKTEIRRDFRAGLRVSLYVKVLLFTLIALITLIAALKGCWGIVFTHGVLIGERQEKFVRPISQKL